ncbi:MAG: glycosyltransferase family 4 protein [Zunongwangia sp.]|uniref:glycosyltransferase family 4 protein n=1 Tax=Zunongwangia sp. TaxID=1965325 RepID=UPI00324256A6
MKILFLSDNLVGGGKERRMIELIKGLDAIESYELYLVSLEEEVYYKEIYNTKCTFKIIKRNRGKGYEFNVQKGLWDYIKKIKPNIIHFWGEVSMIYLLPISFFIKTPIISSIIADTFPKQGFFKNIIRRLGYQITTTILSNTYLGVERYNAPKAKSKVIYNGFDFSRISNLKEEQEIRSRYNIVTEFVVMMVGSYSIRKDYYTFITACEQILKNRKDVTFVSIGGGNNQSLKELINPENSEYYRFLPFQIDVESIMKITTIGVLCSNSDIHGEGISNALLEFMALKKPVIGNNHDGSMELIEDGVSGFLIPPKNSKFLVAKIIKLLDDNSLRNFMGEESFNIVKTKFSISKMIYNFSCLYQKIVK